MKKVKTADRHPSKDDADAHGEVFLWFRNHLPNGRYFWHEEAVRDSECWARIPADPKEEHEARMEAKYNEALEEVLSTINEVAAPAKTKADVCIVTYWEDDMIFVVGKVHNGDAEYEMEQLAHEYRGKEGVTVCKATIDVPHPPRGIASVDLGTVDMEDKE